MIPADKRIERLTQVARMYYEQNMNQSEIARALGVSRPLVSVLLSEARECGIVTITINNVESAQELLAKRLDEAGVSHFTLQGSTPKPVRAEQVRRFNQGEADVFLISLRAGGTGLNLTAADIVIHYDPWWNLAAQNQATDRAYRIGQRNPVQVYRLIAQDTIEEKIVELQQAKQSLADTVTGGADGAILSMNPEQLLQLLGEEA